MIVISYSYLRIYKSFDFDVEVCTVAVLRFLVQFAEN
jgi:hypothetical protein